MAHGSLSIPTTVKASHNDDAQFGASVAGIEVEEVGHSHRTPFGILNYHAHLPSLYMSFVALAI